MQPQVPQLDPTTAALYETAGAETFQEKRLRFSQQETLSFAPWRTRCPARPDRYEASQPALPAPSPPATLTHQGAEGEDGFSVEGLDATQLPEGWQIDDQGYMTLKDTPADCWEVKAGCLIRHHLVP